MNAIKIAYLFDPTIEMTGYAIKRAHYFQQYFAQASLFLLKHHLPFMLLSPRIRRSLSFTASYPITNPHWSFEMRNVPLVKRFNFSNCLVAA